MLGNKGSGGFSQKNSSENDLKKSSSPKPKFKQTLHIHVEFLGDRDWSLFKGQAPLQDKVKVLHNQPACILFSFVKVCLLQGNVSQVRDVAYGPFVLYTPHT